MTKILASDESTPRGVRGARGEPWLVGGGEMGKVIRAMDWAGSPLGPIGSWPQSLRTTVGLCLASNFPISLVWGPQHVQIYNDGYWPICGGKHPHSMGQDFTECWASAWPAIGEAFERALAGTTSFLENQRMFLDRNGYLEETFFTFSFSPIRDETGDVAGLFHPVTETTSNMVSERRTRALRDLAAQAGKAQTTDESFTFAAQTLADFTLDLPFLLFYATDDAGGEARLVAHTGLGPGQKASPLVVSLQTDDARSWPLGQVVRSGRAEQIDDVEQRFGPLVCGPYPEPTKRALALPITPPGAERPAAVLVAGVSSRLPLSDAYRAFFDLLAAGVTAAVANGRAYEEERRRAEALAEIDRAKTTFFSNVSHEFRTPLTLMLGPLEDELAERTDPLPEKRRERIDIAHRNALRLLKLVNTLLDFSRIEAGRCEASFEPSDLSAHTVELVSVFRSAIEKAGLTLTVDCPPLPERVFSDREMWEKIVLNLVSNAFKHTFQGGISVALRWRGDHAELSVTDTGVGIAEAEQPRVFERFHRVKGTRARTHEGTGIGLALVHELVGAHGGTVRVASKEGQGSTFSVTIKAGRAHLPPERVGAERALASTAVRAAAYVEEAVHWGSDAPPPSAASASSTSRPRVLWADDNADMRDYVRRLLADRYDVIAVADGMAALELAEKEPPDLVLTDVMMPRLDGFGLLRQLRANPLTRMIPVILLSARAGEESAVEGLDAGADDYLAKPFSARELLARVKTHVELARARREWAREIKQANEELEAFSYSVSHDLRAPLRAIDGFSKALLSEQGERLDAQGRSHLGRVRAAAMKMSSLIDDLLALARIARSPVRREMTNLTEIARTIVDELRRRDPDRHVDVELEPLTAQADPRLVAIALENLLANAWKYTGKRGEGRLWLGRAVARGKSAFFVRDNGAGFDMAYADKLFQPFQRLHHPSEFEGTGVGLATVQRVVARHGGSIWAEAAVGEGATFFFTLEATR